MGVSLGIGPIDGTIERVASHLQQGYKRIKLKIMPGHDVALFQAVRDGISRCASHRGCQQRLYAGRWRLLQALDQFGLDYIEQPLAWDDIHDHAVLQAHARRRSASTNASAASQTRARLCRRMPLA